MKVREEAYGLSQGWEDLTSVYGPPTDFLLVGGLGSLEIAAADPGHEATESGTCFLNGVFFTFFDGSIPEQTCRYEFLSGPPPSIFWFGHQRREGHG